MCIERESEDDMENDLTTMVTAASMLLASLVAVRRHLRLVPPRASGRERARRLGLGSVERGAVGACALDAAPGQEPSGRALYERHRENVLDQSLADTFPASDPVSMSQPGGGPGATQAPGTMHDDGVSP
jgi:hypothetical protein